VTEAGVEGGSAVDGPAVDGEVRPSCGVPNTPCCETTGCEGGSTCNNGTCVCAADKAACGNACVDTQSDPKNCGRCGHSCLAGTCTAGVCKATTLLSAAAYRAIVEGGRIYYTLYGAPGMQGGVASIKVDGTDAKTHFTLGAGVGCRGIAAAQNKAYFVCGENPRNLYSCDLPSCTTPPATPTVVRPNLGQPTDDVAADPVSGKVFYVVGTAYNQSTGGGVFDSAGTQVGNANQPWPGRVAVGGGFLYWMNWGTYASDQRQVNGGMKRASLTALTSEQSLANESATESLESGSFAIDATTLHFTSRGASGKVSVLAVPIQGGSATPLTTDLEFGALLTADATNVYFNDNDTNTIRYCPKAGCAGGSRLLSENEPGVTMLTSDAESVLWSSAGNMRRIAKP